MSRLAFNDARHQYRLDGEWCPGVTSITGRVGNPGPLMSWATKVAAGYALEHVSDLDFLDGEVWAGNVASAADRERDARAADGRALHAIAERMILGEPMPSVIADVPVSDDVAAMAGQLARFYDAWDVAPVLVESRCFHDGERYAGTLDLVADLHGTRWLLDYKTTGSGIWPKDALQVCAYSRATHYVDEYDEDQPLAAVGIERTGAVHVRPEGWELVPLRTDDGVWAAFLHAYAASDWDRLRRSWSVGNPVPVPERAE